MKEIVRFPGIIKGQGLMATCTVEAIKTSLPGSNDFHIHDYSIIDVSQDLPDGRYDITANGETHWIKHKDGS